MVEECVWGRVHKLATGLMNKETDLGTKHVF